MSDHKEHNTVCFLSYFLPLSSLTAKTTLWSTTDWLLFSFLIFSPPPPWRLAARARAEIRKEPKRKKSPLDVVVVAVVVIIQAGCFSPLNKRFFHQCLNFKPIWDWNGLNWDFEWVFHVPNCRNFSNFPGLIKEKHFSFTNLGITRQASVIIPGICCCIWPNEAPSELQYCTQRQLLYSVHIWGVEYTKLRFTLTSIIQGTTLQKADFHEGPEHDTHEWNCNSNKLYCIIHLRVFT